jgi:hypothetical protein
MCVALRRCPTSRALVTSAKVDFERAGFVGSSSGVLLVLSEAILVEPAQTMLSTVSLLVPDVVDAKGCGMLRDDEMEGVRRI